MKVLIAEDNSVCQDIVKKIVEKRGHEVISARDGGEAWQLLQKNDIRIRPVALVIPACRFTAGHRTHMDWDSCFRERL